MPNAISKIVKLFFGQRQRQRQSPYVQTRGVAEPIDTERQAKLDAELAARKAEWEREGQAAAIEKFQLSNALTLAQAEAEKKLKILDDDEAAALATKPAQQALTRPLTRPTVSFIYLLGRADSGCSFKIGKANDVRRRLAQLNTASDVKLHLIDFRPVPSREVLAIERRIHKLLSKYRQNGEWFVTDLATVRAVVEAETADYNDGQQPKWQKP